MRQNFFCIATSDFAGETTRVDNHKRNLPIIKGHIWILWKLTTILKILSFADKLSKGPPAVPKQRFCA